MSDILKKINRILNEADPVDVELNKFRAIQKAIREIVGPAPIAKIGKLNYFDAQLQEDLDNKLITLSKEFNLIEDKTDDTYNYYEFGPNWTFPDWAIKRWNWRGFIVLNNITKTDDKKYPYYII